MLTHSSQNQNYLLKTLPIQNSEIGIVIGATDQVSNPSRSSSRNFTIIFTGDNHSNLEPTKNSNLTDQLPLLGGIIRRANYISNYVQKNPTLVLDAGDFLSGTAYYDMYKGTADIEMMNRIPYNVVTIGNHDLDKGWDHLNNLLKHASFTVVCANIHEVNHDLPILEPYKILNIEGLSIAIVGIMGTDAWLAIRPSARSGLILQNPDQTLSRIIPELRSKVDIILLLSHSGVIADREFAKNHPLIDIVLGGHSHTFMKQAEQITSETKSTPVFHAYKYGQVLGKIVFEKLNSELKIDSDVVYMDESWDKINPIDQNAIKIQNFLTSYDFEVKKCYSQNIGICVQALSKENMSTQLSTLGIELCEIFRRTTNSDIAFLPSNGIRTGFSIGVITPKDLIEVTPFVEPLMIIKAKGLWIREIMEEGSNRWLKGQRTFQYSGITYIKKNEDKFGMIEVNGEPLKEDFYYSITSCSFFFEREIMGINGKLKSDLEPLIKTEIQEHFESTHETLIQWIQNNGVGKWITGVNQK